MQGRCSASPHHSSCQCPQLPLPIPVTVFYEFYITATLEGTFFLQGSKTMSAHYLIVKIFCFLLSKCNSRIHRCLFQKMCTVYNSIYEQALPASLVPWIFLFSCLESPCFVLPYFYEDLSYFFMWHRSFRIQHNGMGFANFGTIAIKSTV